MTATARGGGARTDIEAALTHCAERESARQTDRGTRAPLHTARIYYNTTPLARARFLVKKSERERGWR